MTVKFSQKNQNTLKISRKILRVDKNYPCDKFKKHEELILFVASLACQKPYAVVISPKMAQHLIIYKSKKLFI